MKSSAHDFLAQSVLAKKGQAKEKMDREWKKSIDSPMQQLFEGDGPGYDNEDDAQYDADASSDGHSSCSQSSDIIGESRHGSFYEGVDAILNNLASQTNAAGVPQDGGDRVGAVTPSGDTKGLLGQYSSMAERHLAASMHTDDDGGEWPPVSPTEVHGVTTIALQIRGQGAASHVSEGIKSPGIDYQSSVPNSPFDPNPPTPLGPSDFDDDGNIITRSRDYMEADPSDEHAAPHTRRVADL